MIPVFKNRPACEGIDTDYFFPDENQKYEHKEYLTRICNGCPAKRECLDYALEYMVDGFWAGTTSYYRHRLRRQRGIQGKPVMPEWELHKRGA